MVKYQDTEERYTLHKDFSHVEVSLEPRKDNKKKRNGR